MNIPDPQVAAIQALGYTPDEARFLFTVATFSGYFVPRQFNAFSGASPGKRSSRFTQKLESRGHATWREYERIGVYHLLSRTLYRRIDRENLRNRRRHSTQFVRTRLLVLDFVLANQDHHYLETEDDKIRYFSALGIPVSVLPAKAYEGGHRSGPTVRYFVDGFPLFLDSSDSPQPPVPTFTYVNPGLGSLAGFTTHLHAYASLFRQLKCFRFLYLSDSPAHFIRAAERFSKVVKPSLEQDNLSDIAHYFRLRRQWEARQFASLTNEDLELLNQAEGCFEEPRFTDLYERWAAGHLTDEDLRRERARPGVPSHARFETWLVKGAANTQAATEIGGWRELHPRTSPLTSR
jgi:hypothetical protein